MPELGFELATPGYAVRRATDCVMSVDVYSKKHCAVSIEVYSEKRCAMAIEVY